MYTYDGIGDWRDYVVKCPRAKIICYSATSLFVYLSMRGVPACPRILYLSAIFSICITPSLQHSPPTARNFVRYSKRNRDRYNTC